MKGQAVSDAKNQLMDNIEQSTELLRFTTAGSVVVYYTIVNQFLKTNTRLLRQLVSEEERRE